MCLHPHPRPARLALGQRARARELPVEAGRDELNRQRRKSKEPPVPVLGKFPGKKLPLLPEQAQGPAS